MAETKAKGGGAAAKVLMPVVATLASAAASYLAKKAPQYLEQRVMPKLRDAKESTGDVASSDAPAEEGTETNDELERRRRERAEHRAARRKAS